MPALLLSLLTLVATVQVVPVDFSTLSSFEWSEGMQLPDKIQALQGKTIGITGFVRSFDGGDENITAFWLVDQNCDCEAIPRMNELIVCVMPEGASISNDGSPVRVVGKLDVGEVKDEDYVTSIYRLQVERVD